MDGEGPEYDEPGRDCAAVGAVSCGGPPDKVWSVDERAARKETGGGHCGSRGVRAA